MIGDGVEAADERQMVGAEVGGLFRLAQYGAVNSLSTRVNESVLRVLI